MIRTVSVAVLVSTIAILPVVLVAALAVLIQADLDFGEAQLGFAVAAYFGSGALAAAPAGRVADKLGPRRTVWLGLACTIGSLVGIALVAGAWAALTVCMILGGIGNALALLGVNVLIVRDVVVQRQGVAFGATQAAVPLAALLAGLSLPAIGLTLGWRWTFVLAAAVAPFACLTMPNGNVRPDLPSRQRNSRFRTLTMLAIGIALASAGGTSSAAFIVAFSVDRGISPGDAGFVLAAGSLAGLAVRIAAGWLGDRRGREALLLVAMLIALGAVGYGGLAFSDHPAHIVFFATLAFGGGWGWPGLVLFAVSRANLAAPGTAMGVATVGGMTGAVVGPLTFGILTEHLAFMVAWLVMGAMAITGAGMMLLSWQRISGRPT